ncbi:MAG: hypothetical protein KDK35_08885 [Leptospiraceae bacterium]|nr:hypothetical protein [Leptospiraceae bacterium]
MDFMQPEQTGLQYRATIEPEGGRWTVECVKPDGEIARVASGRMDAAGEIHLDGDSELGEPVIRRMLDIYWKLVRQAGERRADPEG